MTERRLATVVFTDAVGFTALSSSDESAAIKLMQLDMDTISAAFVQFKGRVVKSTGDGLLAVFDSAADAVQACVEAQRRLAAAQPSEMALQHRMGIHLGDIYFTQDDVLGDGVNVAARLQVEAPVGGIAMSRTVYDVVSGKIRCPAVCIGPKQLKNIATPVEIWQVMPAGSETPPAAEKSGRRTSLSTVVLVCGVAVVALGFGAWRWFGVAKSPASPTVHANSSGVTVMPFDELVAGEPLVIAYAGLSAKEIQSRVTVKVDGEAVASRPGRSTGVFEYPLKKTSRLFAGLEVILDGQEMLSPGYKIAIVPKGLAVPASYSPFGAPPARLPANPIARPVNVGTANTPTYLVGSYAAGSLNDKFPTASDLRDKLIEVGERHKGTPYVWGGNSWSYGLDCSHFINLVFKEVAGINLPPPAESQETYGTVVHRGLFDARKRGSQVVDLRNLSTSWSALQPGDRMIFQTVLSDGKVVRHEGIYIGAYGNFEHSYLTSNAQGGVGFYELTPARMQTYAYSVTDYYLGE